MCAGREEITMNPAGTRIHKDACVMPCMPKEEREELNKSNVVEELGHGAFAWSSVALFFLRFSARLWPAEPEERTAQRTRTGFELREAVSRTCILYICVKRRGEKKTCMSALLGEPSHIPLVTRLSDRSHGDGSPSIRLPEFDELLRVV